MTENSNSGSNSSNSSEEDNFQFDDDHYNMHHSVHSDDSDYSDHG